MSASAPPPRTAPGRGSAHPCRCQHALRAAALHLDRIEAAVAADVEHGPAGQVRAARLARNVATSSPGSRRGNGPARSARREVDVVEPGPELAGCGARASPLKGRGHGLASLRVEPAVRAGACAPARHRPRQRPLEVARPMARGVTGSTRARARSPLPRPSRADRGGTRACRRRGATAGSPARASNTVLEPRPAVADDRRAARRRLEQPHARREPGGHHVGAGDVQREPQRHVEGPIISGSTWHTRVTFAGQAISVRVLRPGHHEASGGPRRAARATGDRG